MNKLIELERLSNFVKGQTCNLEELKRLVKEQNKNAEIETVGKVTFLKCGYKMIISKSKFDGKWFVL